MCKTYIANSLEELPKVARQILLDYKDERIFVLNGLMGAGKTTFTKAVCEVLSWVTHYLDDAKYYKAQGKFETSLTSVAYCEGLLDALRLIGAVNFEWPTKQQEKR